MRMAGRQFGGYRYGFNGKENEVEAGTQDYGMRIYNPALGKFLSVDPIAKDYPWISGYIYAEDEPISNVDLDGLEKIKSISNSIGAGVQQYSNEKKQQAGSVLKYVTSFEPYRDLWGYAKNWGRAVTGDKDAIQKVNQQTTKAITNSSLTVASAISKPAIFFSTMHLRLAEENLQGATYYGLKGLELYGAVKIPEFLESTYNGRFKVDLMGGQKSTLGTEWINFDRNAIEGISDDVANFKFHFQRNSVSEIIINNPRAEFLQHVTESLKPGGTITIRGTLSNKYFNKIYNGKATGLDNYILQEVNVNVPNLGYKQTSGEAIRGEIHEIRLIKK